MNMASGDQRPLITTIFCYYAKRFLYTKANASLFNKFRAPKLNQACEIERKAKQALAMQIISAFTIISKLVMHEKK